ncbi:MAG: hypothetical protein OEX00_03605 [Gammaproteobacteria bacterium]|nr:hypothetical protein [Gammaproteobacteria bacterium]MDH5693025.1 hypothetical protein [Gammaproteobacteria bacterium]
MCATRSKRDGISHFGNAVLLVLGFTPGNIAIAAPPQFQTGTGVDFIDRTTFQYVVPPCPSGFSCSQLIDGYQPGKPSEQQFLQRVLTNDLGTEKYVQTFVQIRGEGAELESFNRIDRPDQGSGIKFAQRFRDIAGGPVSPGDTLSQPMVPNPDQAWGSFAFTGDFDTRLNAPAERDPDQVALAQNFDQTDLVSMRMRLFSDTHGARSDTDNGAASGIIAYVGANFEFAGVSDATGEQLSSDILNLQEVQILRHPFASTILTGDALLNGTGSYFGPVSDPGPHASRWRADVESKQQFYFLSSNLYNTGLTQAPIAGPFNPSVWNFNSVPEVPTTTSNGNQYITGQKMILTQNLGFAVQLNPNADTLITSHPGNTADNQWVYDNYDVSYMHVVRASGDKLTASTGGVTLAGRPDGSNAGTLSWAAGIAGDLDRQIQSTLIAQRFHPRDGSTLGMEFTYQTLIEEDLANGTLSQVEQIGGVFIDIANGTSDANGGQTWDWDLSLTPEPPRAPALALNPFTGETTPYCLPTDPFQATGQDGIC